MAKLPRISFADARYTIAAMSAAVVAAAININEIVAPILHHVAPLHAVLGSRGATALLTATDLAAAGGAIVAGFGAPPKHVADRPLLETQPSSATLNSAQARVSGNAGVFEDLRRLGDAMVTAGIPNAGPIASSINISEAPGSSAPASPSPSAPSAVAAAAAVPAVSSPSTRSSTTMPQPTWLTELEGKALASVIAYGTNPANEAAILARIASYNGQAGAEAVKLADLVIVNTTAKVPFISMFAPEIEAAVAANEPALVTALGSLEQLEYAKLVAYLQALDATLTA